MPRIPSSAWAAALAALILATALPGLALAHERRTIGGGKYEVVVGWDVEPAFQGEKNAASIRISKAGTNPAEPVQGAEKTLKVQIRQGAQTRELALRTVFNQPGYYVADIVPTRDGDYQWTFVGTIGDDPVNEKFDTADGKFNAVQPIAALQFPVSLGDTAQSTSALRDARAAAESAQTLAYVGMGLGALGVILGALAWTASGRQAGSQTGRPGKNPEGNTT